MTNPQKAICKYLLRRCYAQGFDSFYKIAEVAKACELSEQETVADIHELNGKGLLNITCDEKFAQVNFDMKGLVEDWSR